MSKERELLKRALQWIDLDASLIKEIEECLAQEPETARVWYQKGYAQGMKDAQPSIYDEKYQDEMLK